MEIDKDTVLSLLRERGQDQEAARAEEEFAVEGRHGA